ncbi:hypothetical protein Tco_0904206 [Tanacetum coccineum]
MSTPSTPAISSVLLNPQRHGRAFDSSRQKETKPQLPPPPVKAVEQSFSTSVLGTFPVTLFTNPKEDLKGITTQVVSPSKDQKLYNPDTESRNPNPEPNVSPVDTPIPKASIPFPSRRNDERRKEKANEQIEKFYEIFKGYEFQN